MAIAKKDIFVAPSVDMKFKDELDSVQIESGIFHCNEEITIGSITSSKWTVICMSNETKDGLQCYSQIWSTVLSNTSRPRLFLRTAAPGQTTYSAFSSFINCPTDEAVDVYIGGTAPEAENGVTKIFIDLDKAIQ